MVALDECFDLAQSGAKIRLENTRPPRAATLLWEQLRELTRTDDTYTAARTITATSRGVRSAPAETLRMGTCAPRRPIPPALEAAFQAAGQSCAACHTAHRNKMK